MEEFPGRVRRELHEAADELSFLGMMVCAAFMKG